MTQPGARTPEPATRIINMNRLGRELLEQNATPPVNVLFVYNCQPGRDAPDQNAVIAGLGAKISSRWCSIRCMTDTAPLRRRRAAGHDVPRELRSRSGYGAYALQLGSRSSTPVGESRPNNEVFGELAGGSALRGRRRIRTRPRR